MCTDILSFKGNFYLCVELGPSAMGF